MQTRCSLQPCFHISDRPQALAGLHPFHRHRAVIELCRGAIRQQLHHIGHATEHAIQIHPRHTHRALHRAVAAGIKAQRREQRMRFFDQ